MGRDLLGISTELPEGVLGCDWPFEARRGCSAVRVAILDGVVDASVEDLDDCRLRQLGPLASVTSPTSHHGTAVASFLFGKDGEIRQCDCLSIPVLEGAGTIGAETGVLTVLSEAIELAVLEGALVVNISVGSDPQNTGVPQRLMEAVRRCKEARVLLIAAGGNRAGETFDLPAALPGVLAVGAVTEGAELQRVSSWDDDDPTAVCALGEIPGMTGTSAACAKVTAVAVRLLCALAAHGMDVDPLLVSRALRVTATPMTGRRRGQLIDPPRALAWLLDRAPAGLAARRGAGRVEPRGGLLQPIAIPMAQPKVGHQSATYVSPTRIFSATRSYLVHDLRQVRAEGGVPVPMIPTTETLDGARELDTALRCEGGLRAGSPVYALLVYARSEEREVPLWRLLKTYKRRLGYQHVGAYLGTGRTTQALAERSLPEWSRFERIYYRLNVREKPAHVFRIGLCGVDQGTLNRNLSIADMVLAGDLQVPDDVEALAAPVACAAAALRFYRDLLLDSCHLPKTNCADRKYIVVHVGLNLPHNPAAFSQTYGEDGPLLWAAFLAHYERLTGTSFDEPVAFVPLWQQEGAAPHDLSSAAQEGQCGAAASVKSSVGTAWTPLDIPTLMEALQRAYAPLESAGGLLLSIFLASLRPVISHVLELSEPLVQRWIDRSLAKLVRASLCTQGETSASRAAEAREVLSLESLHVEPPELRERVVERFGAVIEQAVVSEQQSIS